MRETQKMPESLRTAVEYVHVFNGSGFSDEQTVIFEGDRIVSLSEQAGPGDDVVDGRGRYLLPGFIDSHLHLTRRSSLEECARWGLTTVLDLGSRDPGVVEELQQSRDPGLPVVLRAGLPATAPGSTHVRKMGFPAASQVAGPADAVRFVAERVAAGSDYIKVIAEDPKIPGNKALPTATIAAIVQAAHDAGKLVIAHTVTAASVRIAGDAGVDVITHAPLDADLSAEQVAALASRSVVLVPTLLMMRDVIVNLSRRPMLRALTALRIAPRLDLAHAQATVAAFRQAGATILVGTDANIESFAPAHPPFGSGFHEELTLLVEAGLTPLEALRSATVLAADVFGLADRGAVRPGLRADLVLLDRDPVENIGATRDIHASWIGGVRIDK
jgi:imidazolonepropionase-like amidohydrolase